MIIRIFIYILHHQRASTVNRFKGQSKLVDLDRDSSRTLLKISRSGSKYHCLCLGWTLHHKRELFIRGQKNMVTRLTCSYEYGRNWSLELHAKLRKSFSEASPVLILEVFWHSMRRKAHPTKEVFCKIGIPKWHPQLIDWFGMCNVS